MRTLEQVPIISHSISVATLRRHNGITQTLLLRRTGKSIPGAWAQIAGGIEPGERAWQAAVREMREETGLAPDRVYSADYCEQFYAVEKETIILAPVFVAFIDTDQPIVLNNEHDDYL